MSSKIDTIKQQAIELEKKVDAIFDDCKKIRKDMDEITECLKTQGNQLKDLHEEPSPFKLNPREEFCRIHGPRLGKREREKKEEQFPRFYDYLNE